MPKTHSRLPLPLGCSPLRLAWIARTGTLEERHAVARHPGTHPRTLTWLVTLGGRDLSQLVAQHVGIPHKAAHLLYEQDLPQVRVLLTENPTTPPDILRSIYVRGNTVDSVCLRLAGNPRTPVDLLEVLCQHESRLVRRVAAVNPNTPEQAAATAALSV